MHKTLLIGSSGHAKVAIEIVEQYKDFCLLGLIDSFRTAGEITSGYPVLGTEDDIPKLIAIQKITHFFVAIGDNYQRQKMTDKIHKIAPSLILITLIHKSAIVSPKVSIGQGTIVMAGAVINVDTRIGKGCIINTQSSIDHECDIADYCSIAPRAVLGGRVGCHLRSVVSIGATVLQKIIIQKDTIIGAGAVVIRDCNAESIYIGCPAKWHSTREIDAPYL
jgi:sugar O-acyltransferase (sialic acid O-acetyltransferase NeuD family)